jgi:glucose/arabinose dehydrogenase
VKSHVSFSGCALLVAGVAAFPIPVARAAEAAAAPPVPVIALRQVADGLTSPLTLVPLDDGSGRMLVGDQVGTIHILNKDGALAPDLFGDLTPRMVQLKTGFDERGLLGLVLHPKFQANGRLFAYYSAPLRASAPTNFDHTARLSEFHVTPGDKAKLDPSSERVVLELDEPQFNHNCGRLVFGPDGFLYVGVGDGGNANDEGAGHAAAGNGQTGSTLLGKILRLNVDGQVPYEVPKDNPFVGRSDFRPEIFAYGLRNPWGLSFDRGGTRELFAADVGQNLFEEVNIVVAGGNYGWRVREGFEGFDPKNPDKAATNAPVADAQGRRFRDPIFAYKHPPRNKVDPSTVSGLSITGGYIYRGRALPQLTGRYLFGDWSRSWALPDGVLLVATRPDDNAGPWKVEFLDVKIPGNGRLGGFITGFGEDAEGEIYVLINGRSTLTGKTGKVFKVVPM